MDTHIHRHMDTYIHTETDKNTILLCHEEKKFIISKKIDGTRDHRRKRNKPTPDKYCVLSLISETYRLEKNQRVKRRADVLEEHHKECQEDIHCFVARNIC